MTTPAASRKDKYGNRTYTIPHPETRELVELPSWTKLKNLMHSSPLETWKLKKVATAVAQSTALQMQAANPDTCYQAVKKAMQADTEKADVGTYVHRYTEQVDDGTLDWQFVPEAAKPYIVNYQTLKTEWAWQVAEAEATVFNLAYGYAGSADRFNRFPGLPALLGLPDPERDVFAVDVKTGEKVWAETALQLAAYANGEGIFEAPTKLAHGFTQREAQLDEWIAEGTNIPPGRRKWSDDAIRQAKAELENDWWKIFAEHGRFRPMPEGLRHDVGLVVHLRSEGASVVPVRLDGDPPALYVIDGLTALYRWQRRKEIVCDPVVRYNSEQPAVEPEPAPETKQDRKRARLATEQPGTPENRAIPAEQRFQWLRGRLQAIAATGGTAMAETAANWPAGVPTLRQFAHDDDGLDRIIELLDTIEAAHEIPFGPTLAEHVSVAPTSDAEAVDKLADTFPGGVEVATVEDKQPYINWLRQFTERDPQAGAQIVAELDKAGLRKSLSGDEWTLPELQQLGQVLRRTEKAATAATNNQQPLAI